MMLADGGADARAEELCRLEVIIRIVLQEGYCQVNRMPAQQIRQQRCRNLMNGQRHHGVYLIIFGQDVGENTRDTESRGQTDRDVSALQLFHVSEPLQSLTGVVNDFLRINEQCSSLCRKLYVLTHAMKKRHIEFGLQLLDLLRERTLCHVRPSCRLSETQCLGSIDEISQLSDFHYSCESLLDGIRLLCWYKDTANKWNIKTKITFCLT